MSLSSIYMEFAQTDWTFNIWNVKLMWKMSNAIPMRFNWNILSFVHSKWFVVCWVRSRSFTPLIPLPTHQFIRSIGTFGVTLFRFSHQLQSSFISKSILKIMLMRWKNSFSPIHKLSFRRMELGALNFLMNQFN